MTIAYCWRGGKRGKQSRDKIVVELSAGSIAYSDGLLKNVQMLARVHLERDEASVRFYSSRCEYAECESKPRGTSTSLTKMIFINLKRKMLMLMKAAAARFWKEEKQTHFLGVRSKSFLVLQVGTLEMDDIWIWRHQNFNSPWAGVVQMSVSTFLFVVGIS